MKKEIVIILQAREHSKRFKGKIFKKINNKTILEIILNELVKIKTKPKIFVATSNKTNKEKILKIAKKYNSIPFFGSESNVFSRFYKLCEKNNIKYFIRLTADNPLIHHKEIERFIKFFQKKKYDYISNLIRTSYPEGYSIEVVDFKLLKKINKKKLNKLDKEHVTYSIVKNKINSKNYNMRFNSDLSKYRITCDYKSDFDVIKKIFNDFNYRIPTLQKLINNKNFKSTQLFEINKSLHYE
tara:strand:+ start:957 stop:1679 length:723 start_codon:yes stop_codon:yes gene_type:complete